MTESLNKSWLLRETLKLLDQRHHSVSLSSIAEKAGVTPSWLRMFAAGKISGASVVSVEAVYNVLADKPLGE